ncbi:hypothetical protein ACJIZ3_022191 [Penstemon smallii]|uniref:Uncharacterized protein n=1 Tax=Penstemon smallii TaxID=265156 RepID=A0ABD3SPH0_9LAMI
MLTAFPDPVWNMEFDILTTLSDGFCIPDFNLMAGLKDSVPFLVNKSSTSPRTERAFAIEDCFRETDFPNPVRNIGGFSILVRGLPWSKRSAIEGSGKYFETSGAFCAARGLGSIIMGQENSGVEPKY